MPREMSQMTLGEMVDAVALIARRHEADFTIKFAWVHCKPDGLASYRGYYEQLAIGWTSKSADVLIGDFLKELQEAVGKEYTGWKGGTYEMRRGTPMWVANPGETGSTAVIDVIDAGWCAVIETAWGE